MIYDKEDQQNFHINNFDDIVNNILEFPTEDSFYYIEVMARKKDNPNGKACKMLKTYTIKSVEDLVKIQPEIISICNQNNARAYLDVSPRSVLKANRNIAKYMIDNIDNKQINYRSMITSCIATSTPVKKRWLFDWDNKNIPNDFLNCLNMFGVNILTYLQTKNGWHIIVEPFNINKFKNEFPNAFEGFDDTNGLQKKSWMTILYV